MATAAEPTTEQLKQQVADLQAANAALLEGHSRLSIAYLAQRVSALEKKVGEHGGRLGTVESTCRQLKEKDASLERSLQQARDAFTSLRQSVEARDPAFNKPQQATA